MKLIYLTLFFAIASNPASAELQGSPQAIEKARALVQSMGGKTAWQDLTYIHASIHGYLSYPPYFVNEEFWTELREPYMYFRMTGDDFDYIRSVTPNVGWKARNDKYSQLSVGESDRHRDFWSRSEHVLYYRLAIGDSSLRVELPMDRRLEFFSVEDGESLGWIEMNDDSEPIKWNAPLGDGFLTYLFGPLVEFGDVRLPKWGVTIDGKWRFENVDADAGTDAPDISYDPPSRFVSSD